MEKVSLTTEDGVRLAGLLWDAQSRFSVLLLHMMPATKESWTDLANRLFHRGFNVLAIDFRGHGQSDGGSYKSFSDEEHQKYLIDAQAALKYLLEKYPKTEISLGGASIGANIALQLMSRERLYAKGVVLSAGLNYHGVNAEEYIQLFDHNAQKVLFVTSKDDGNNVEQTSCLHDFAENSQEIIYDTGGHGTDMWKEHPELLDQIVEFYIND
jgi:alpha-beta hydrolase superfamily lysophospholipase